MGAVPGISVTSGHFRLIRSCFFFCRNVIDVDWGLGVKLAPPEKVTKGAYKAQNLKAGLHVIFYYYSACLYFTSDNVPDGIN
jgi:hypothetical protein